MGILARFKNIMASNINALLDKAEDPEKMVDQILRDLQDNLGEVKAETAGIMAEEARAKREYDEASAEVSTLQSYAEKALVAGNEDDARTFLQKKQAKAEEVTALKQAYDLAAANAVKMKQMHQHLTQQIQEMQGRRDAIKAKMAVAKTQQKINEIGSSIKNASGSISEFDRMEAKAERMLDQANAMAELNAAEKEESVEDLMAKYDTPSQSVEDELAALKAKLGK
ncbi:MAG: PspA/IM30 family protein [Lachnospiraceae bacterium]|jgi:phage shock protein A|nr:PspA/IM30 family protein [Lachnospiraceae bacterium]